VQIEAFMRNLAATTRPSILWRSRPNSICPAESSATSKSWSVRR
jgi:hypothetical protein